MNATHVYWKDRAERAEKLCVQGGSVSLDDPVVLSDGSRLDDVVVNERTGERLRVTPLLTTEETLYYGGRKAPTSPLRPVKRDTYRDAGEGFAVASEMIALETARDVVAEAFRMVLDRLGEMERAAFKLRGSPTLADQYGALIAGFEDVLAEMSDSVNTEDARE